MKIDYVISYVDPTDPNWQDLYNQYQSDNHHSKQETANRFAENRLFKYVFRGIDRHLPWINDVILLVQSESQVPTWIDKRSVRIVTHDQFIPKQHLPTFNSCTIECFLHKIPGLSPLFIYGNDDMYVINDCHQEDFFQGIMPLNRVRLMPYDVMNPTFHNLLCDNMSRFVCGKLGLPYTYRRSYFVPTHGQNAFSTAIFKRIYDEFHDDIENSISRFRDKKNFSQYMFVEYYMLSTGNQFVSDIPIKRIDINENFSDVVYFMNNEHDIIKLLCLNNNNEANDIQLLHMFNNLYPDKSKFEL